MTTELALPDKAPVNTASFKDFWIEFQNVGGHIYDKRPMPPCRTRDLGDVFRKQQENFPKAIEINTAYCIGDVSVKNGMGVISVHQFDDHKIGEHIVNFSFPQELVRINTHIFLDSFRMHNFCIEIIRIKEYSLNGKYGIQIGPEQIVFTPKKS